MLEDVVNPAVPSTTGALLAEEWTINPLATLPSFLEMFMMDEASRSARKSLDAGMGVLREKLQTQAADAIASGGVTNSSEDDNNDGSRRRGSLAFLASLLRRSTTKMASAVAHSIQHYGPEISCLILYCLERHCLRSDSCATISESLYGGRQAKLDRSIGNENGKSTQEHRKLLPLTDRDKTRLALLVALGPYIRHRLLLFYQNLKQQSSSQEQSTEDRRLFLLQKLRELFVWVYPVLHVSLSSMDLIYQWRYLLGHSVFFHPYAHMLGLVVRRVTQEDSLKSQGNASATAAESLVPTHPSAPASTAVPQSPVSANSTASTSAPSFVRNAAVWVLSSAVILSWVSHFRAEYQRQRQELMMQQEQQQHQHGNQPTNNGNRNNNIHRNVQGNTNICTMNPPPPSSGMKNTLPAHLCPLCRQPRMHPTASSSGVVFCYKCLLQHVKETGKCPVTGRDCREAQLLRLYEPNHSISS